METVALALAGRFFTTESPGNPPRGCFKFQWQIGLRGPLRFTSAGCLEDNGKLGGWILTWKTCSMIDY